MCRYCGVADRLGMIGNRQQTSSTTAVVEGEMERTTSARRNARNPDVARRVSGIPVPVSRQSNPSMTMWHRTVQLYQGSRLPVPVGRGSAAEKRLVRPDVYRSVRPRNCRSSGAEELPVPSAPEDCGRGAGGFQACVFTAKGTVELERFNGDRVQTYEFTLNGSVETEENRGGVQLQECTATTTTVHSDCATTQ